MTDILLTRDVPPNRELIEGRLVAWYFLAAIGYLFVSMFGGFLMAFQLIRHNPLQGIELLSPGRWRMIHTNAVAYGFIANAFLGILHWIVPRLTLRPVLNRPLSYFIFAAWQIVVLSTAGGLMLGEAQELEWGETPVWIDPLAQLGLLLVAINFLAPIVKIKGPMAKFVRSRIDDRAGRCAHRVPLRPESRHTAGRVGSDRHRGKSPSFVPQRRSA